MMTNLEPFIELQKKSNRVSVIVGVVIMAFGAALYAIPANTDKDLWIKLGIMAFFIVFGVILIAVGLVPAESAAGIVKLRDQPDDVVWLYVQRRLRNGQHIGSSLHLGLISGKVVNLPLAIGREDELQRLAHQHAPHAHLGFDPALDAQFKKNPLSRRRA